MDWTGFGQYLFNVNWVLEFISFPHRRLVGFVTGKSLSESLILGSTNPQYDKRLFIDLSVQSNRQ